MSVIYNTNVVTDSLVSYWDCANRKSYPGAGTTITDLVGGNNGTLTNGPVFDSSNKGNISFDGNDKIPNVGINIKQFILYSILCIA